MKRPVSETTIQSCGTGSEVKLPLLTKHPRQNLCFFSGKQKRFQLQSLGHPAPSKSRRFSAPEGELGWWGVFPDYSIWDFTGMTVVPLQWGFQPFLRTRLTHQKSC